MATKSATKKPAAKPKSVVMSVRVWPDVEAGFRQLAEETGLSLAMLMSNALDLLRADPATKELIEASKAYDATLGRIMAAKKGRAAGVAKV